MKLLEREIELQRLHLLFSEVEKGKGQTVVVKGEAGVGKTTLTNAFISEIEERCLVYRGACDSLFTPRPMGPMYDISLSISPELYETVKMQTDRSVIFSDFQAALQRYEIPVVLVIEDLHWGDEATLDFVKFLIRRIINTQCMLILTLRNEDLSKNIHVQTTLGSISSNLITRISLDRFSIETVQILCENSNLVANRVYHLTDGNPFFVSELLLFSKDKSALKISENVKEAILARISVYPPRVVELLNLIAIVPGKIAISILEHLEAEYYSLLEICIEQNILLSDGDHLFFRHEIARLTIEESLTPLKRKILNNQMLMILLQQYNVDELLDRIVHHAQMANDQKTVAEYAPKAALRASNIGAHIQSAKLYEVAITYSKDQSFEKVCDLKSKYAYELYLTNQIKDAIAVQTEVLELSRKTDDLVLQGRSHRLLSRFNWFNSDFDRAITHSNHSIKVLQRYGDSVELAMAFSNMCQLMMLSGKLEKVYYWGNKAIDMADKLGAIEIKCHALINIGSAEMQIPKYSEVGLDKLLVSIQIAQLNKYHEHAARAFTNLGSCYVLMKDYKKAEKYLDEGLSYCEKHDLDTWYYYIQTWQSRFFMEMGQWAKADNAAQQILDLGNQPNVVRIGASVILGRVQLRQKKLEGLKYLEEARLMALSSNEIQRIAPVLVAFLEYIWIYNESVELGGIIDKLKELIYDNDASYLAEVNFWLHQNSFPLIDCGEMPEVFRASFEKNPRRAADLWKNKFCLYESAVVLSTGTNNEKLEALGIFEDLGAVAVVEKLKQEMRARGMKNIPRGPRPSTTKNPENLTKRQMEILTLLKEGFRNKEIADQLFISNKTVDNHVSAILLKLNASSRNQAVAKARRAGYID